MSEWRNGRAYDVIGMLVRTVPVRLLDIGRNGCRLETARWLEPGTTGQLLLSIDGQPQIDDVRVVRCQLRVGAGSLYQVGIELLGTKRLHRRSIRLAISHLVREGAAPGAQPATEDRRPWAQRAARGGRKLVLIRPPPKPAGSEN